jgi:hypothetical protein
MAKYDCIPPVTGTIGDFCIYQMHGEYFLRSRSSLTGNRVKKDPAFRKTMYFAGLMAKASRIGSVVYAALPAGNKKHPLYLKLTGEAMTWLKYGWTEEDVLQWLQKRYTPQEIIACCEQLDEEPAETEEEMISHFMARINKRLLKALRQGDYSILDG